jgi:hypothetical protein
MLTIATVYAVWSRLAGFIGLARASVGGAGAALKRFGNGNAAVALIGAALVVALLIAVIWLRQDAASTATAGRDAEWSSRLYAARLAAWQARWAKNRAATVVVDTARIREAEAERDAAIARASDLEVALARMRDDPVAFRASVTKELRK